VGLGFVKVSLSVWVGELAGYGVLRFQKAGAALVVVFGRYRGFGTAGLSVFVLNVD